MNFEHALQDAREGRVIAREDWPAIQALVLQLNWNVGGQVTLTGRLVTVAGDSYQSTEEDRSAQDWRSTH